MAHKLESNAIKDVNNSIFLLKHLVERKHGCIQIGNSAGKACDLVYFFSVFDFVYSRCGF